MAVLELEVLNLINNRLELISKTRGELQVLKDQLDDALANDKDYQDAQKEAEVAKESKMLARQKVESNSSVMAVAKEIKEKRTELKDLKDALSAELVEYYKNTGNSEITLANGKTYQFSFSVKLS
jgi:hypothetical protein